MKYDFFKFLILMISFLLIISGCSKNKDRSRLVVQFDASVFQNASSKVSASTTANPDGPDWGLNDPTSLSDLSCFGIFVYADEEGMKESQCNIGDNGGKMKFGPRAGFFPINGQGEIFVPAGPNRRVILAGMASSDGGCFSDFEENADFDFSNYSAPFLIGQETVNLESGDNQVEIHLTDDFSSSKKIIDCDFIKDDDDDQSDPITSLTLAHYPSSRSVWVDDNITPRRVDIIYDSNAVDKVECSKDGGTTYSEANCSGGSPATYMIWTPVDRGATHAVKITYNNGTTETETFIPDLIHPDLSTFVTCDKEFFVSNNFDVAQAPDTTSFLSAIGTINNVVCLDDGVDIHDGGATLSLTDSFAANVNLIVRQGHNASITSNASAQDTIAMTSSISGIKFIGVDIINNANTGAKSAINLTGGGVSNIVFEDVYVSTNYGRGLSVNGATGILFRANSKIDSDNGTGVYVGSSGTLSVDQADIVTAGGSTVKVVNGGSFTATHSILENDGLSGSDYILNFPDLGGGTFNISDSKLIDSSGGAIHFDVTTVSVTYNIDNVEHIRENSATAGHSTGFINIINGSGSATINSTNNGNSYCHKNLASAAITADPITGSFSGTYTPGSQINGGGSYICP